MEFEFRTVRQEEAEETARIERICFPPHEACTREMMIERVKRAPEYLLVAVDQETGKIAGYITGICTEEEAFRDEFFFDASLHAPQGNYVMILGVEVLPDYRGQGVARELMARYLRMQRKNGKRMVVLTCLDEKVRMYEKMGFVKRGFSRSNWGGERWHEMECILDSLAE